MAKFMTIEEIIGIVSAQEKNILEHGRKKTGMDGFHCTLEFHKDDVKYVLFLETHKDTAKLIWGAAVNAGKSEAVMYWGMGNTPYAREEEYPDELMQDVDDNIVSMGEDYVSCQLYIGAAEGYFLGRKVTIQPDWEWEKEA